jgi:hypothetical protein
MWYMYCFRYREIHVGPAIGGPIEEKPSERAV